MISISKRTPAAAGIVLLLAAGCVKRPHLGKDEGREAIVWQHENLALTEPPPAGTPAEQDGAALLSELAEAERTGRDDLALAGTLYRAGILRRQQGDLAEAERLYRRALAIREREQGPNHLDVAAVLNNLGIVEAAQGNEEAARPLLERALSIRQTALGKAHLLTAESLNNLALLYAAQGNTAAAEPLYRRAVAILEQTAGHGGELKRVLENYAALLQDSGRPAEAEALEARARVMRAAAPPPQLAQ